MVGILNSPKIITHVMEKLTGTLVPIRRAMGALLEQLSREKNSLGRMGSCT